MRVPPITANSLSNYLRKEHLTPTRALRGKPCREHRRPADVVDAVEQISTATNALIDRAIVRLAKTSKTVARRRVKTF
jgi:hypothetical protein